MAYTVENPTAFDVDENLQRALDNAHAVCSENSESPECANAWDEVEEIQAAIAHKRQKAPKSGFETYCDENPDADECRVYDV